MDMDIDDILASVDRENEKTVRSSKAGRRGHTDDAYDGYGDSAANIDHQELTRLWVAERGTSELLPWPTGLMERMMNRIRRQIDKVEELAATGMETSGSSANPTLNLKLLVLQSDLARSQYMIRSMLRQRLSKLTKFPIYYLRLSSGRGQNSSSSQTQSQSQPSQFNNDNYPRSPDSFLSPSEHSFVLSHFALLSQHFATSFLSSFPVQLRKLDDTAGGVSMVDQPSVKEVVCVRCLAPEVSIVVPLGEMTGTEAGDWEPDYASSQDVRLGQLMKRGEIWLVRWEGVKTAWKKGDVEVL